MWLRYTQNEFTAYGVMNLKRGRPCLTRWNSQSCLSLSSSFIPVLLLLCTNPSNHCLASINRLRHHSVEAPNQPRQALPYNKSISIDLLFASPVVSSAILPNLIPKASTSKESPLHQRNDNTKPAGLQLLDSIFKSVEQVRLSALVRSRC